MRRTLAAALVAASSLLVLIPSSSQAAPASAGERHAARSHDHATTRPYLDDVLGKKQRVGFAAEANKWPTSRLTWKLDHYSSRSDLRGKRAEVENALAKAMNTWAKASKLRFTKTTGSKANIKIGFHTGDHGDNAAFDGKGGVLAHAYEPQWGMLHFDDQEPWSTTAQSGRTDLSSVALHELGHILGLDHSADRKSIMYPYYTGGKTLGQEDIQRIQALYGAPGR
ncbi:M10 family metallopeptidase domain-containing protein [Streptomyces sp. NPDC048612]|uniref:M10 family metallopeptidase domain-containing protein n=1 Tax=Streptomyces sp. NPDC048612 TaxID=3365579 RepID=UPI00371BF8D6